MKILSPGKYEFIRQQETVYLFCGRYYFNGKKIDITKQGIYSVSDKKLERDKDLECKYSQ